MSLGCETGEPMGNSTPSVAVSGVLTVIPAVSGTQEETGEPNFAGK